MPKVRKVIFSEDIVKAVAQAIGDTNDGLTNAEITDLFQLCHIPEQADVSTKWKRIHYNLWNHQVQKKTRVYILEFIRQAMKPARHLKCSERFDEMRNNLNKVLSFEGLSISKSGEIVGTQKVTTISEAEERANILKSSLSSRGVHPDVLKFCRSELLVDNYFHAVQEAVKSIFDKMRSISGIFQDGNKLVDAMFSGDKPAYKINQFQTQSEQSEQRGFVNLVKGTYSMFRNTTAHEARINWKMTKEDAEDLLSLASMIHRRLDMLNKK